MNFERHLFALQFPDRLLQQPYIGVVADCFNVPVLFAAEQVAGAAQLEIESGDFEAGAQVAEFFEGGQTLCARSRLVGCRPGPADTSRRADWSGPRVLATGTVR